MISRSPLVHNADPGGGMGGVTGGGGLERNNQKR